MRSAASPETTTAVRNSYAALRDAMLLADTAALDTLLDDEFSLTHMTGYRQPKAEWLADIDAGEMRYHDIDDVELAAGQPGEESIVLTARTMTEATIWGAHGTWRLQLRIHYEKRAGSWIALRSVASTW